MNNWQNEFIGEYHRQRILEEVEQIRLERLALKSRVYRPRFFERAMFSFGNWMIVTGKQLRKRYTRSTICLANRVDEVPSVNCNHPPTGSFAH